MDYEGLSLLVAKGGGILLISSDLLTCFPAVVEMVQVLSLQAHLDRAACFESGQSSLLLTLGFHVFSTAVPGTAKTIELSRAYPTV